ncbi:MAG: hypothetical protein JXA95_19010 [Spirochaetales bacterium]|nr:hypothetical protein [Spirochaetales bacterium]
MTPIKQLKNVRQRPEEGFRLWYANEYFDVIFWYEEEGGFIKGFQFCYGKPHSEKAFTWETDSQSHHYVREARAQGTGILRGDAGDLSLKTLKQFQTVRGELPEPLMNFVIGKLLAARGGSQENTIPSPDSD